MHSNKCKVSAMKLLGNTPKETENNQKFNLLSSITPSCRKDETTFTSQPSIVILLYCYIVKVGRTSFR